jgi:hypothetical protein
MQDGEEIKLLDIDCNTWSVWQTAEETSLQKLNASWLAFAYQQFNGGYFCGREL